MTAKGLTHATALVFPEPSHAALVFSQCARDFGLSFVECPTPPQTDCIARLKPKWILPPGLDHPVHPKVD